MIPQFALRLIVGLSALWCVLPRPLITSGFFRIQMLVTLGLGVLGCLTAGHWPGAEDGAASQLWMLRGGFIGIAVVSFLGSVLWTLERRRGGTRLAVLTAVGAALLLGWQSTSLTSSAAPAALQALGSLGSGWLVGSVTGAMLLGHWYLTATGMALAPLESAVRWAQLAAVVRCGLVAAGITLASSELRTALTSTHLVWTILRVAAGLVGPLVLTFMTPGTLKYRNTQSATGVLFAATILAFIGEAAALLLTRDLKWPF